MENLEEKEKVLENVVINDNIEQHTTNVQEQDKELLEKKFKHLKFIIMKYTGCNETTAAEKLQEHNNNHIAVINEFRIKKFKEVIMRQTDYDDATTEAKLKEYNYDSITNFVNVV